MRETDDEFETSDETPRRRRGFLAGWLLGALVGGLVVGIGAVAASHASGAFGGGHGFGHGGFGRHHGGGHDPEHVREHVRVGVEYAAKYLDADEAQVEALTALAEDAVDRMLALHDPHAANREALIAWLASPDADPETLSALVDAELELAREAADELEVLAVGVAQTLTPEQRRTLIETLERFRHHGH